MRDALGADLPIVAEDLGTITPDVHQLREEFQFPGMRVLQFAFGGDPHDTHLPHEYTRNTVAYTGTHDNDTVVGWFEQRGRARVHLAATVDVGETLAAKFGGRFAVLLR